MNCLVIGGTGYIGRALVAALLKEEHSVTVLHRRARHDLGRRVANIAADRNDAPALKAALAGKKFDVVFDNVYDWERGTTAGHIEATARACGDSLRRYIFMSSVAAYGDGKNHPYYREAFFWDRIRAGRPIILPGDGRRLMQFVYVKDLVRAAVKVMVE